MKISIVSKKLTKVGTGYALFIPSSYMKNELLKPDIFYHISFEELKDQEKEK